MKRQLSLALLLCLYNVGWTQDLIISNARVIDGTGGVIERGSVAVENGRIISVSDGNMVIAGAQEIDAQGMTIMPGFIDAHRHLIEGDPVQWLDEQASDRMQEFLDAGFTTVLSAGDSLEAILELRRRLEENEINGPRLMVTGRVSLARSSDMARRASGVDPARLDLTRPPNRPMESATPIPHEETLVAVRELAAAGVDAIKTVMIVTPGGPELETLSVIATEAERLGIPSITHAVTVEDTLAAVEAGTHVLVHTPHIGQLDQETTLRIVDSGIPMMSTLGVFVPTFAAENAHIRSRTGHDNLPRFRDLEPFPIGGHLASAGQGPVNARLLWDAGITYGFGTDTRFLPRDSLAHELRPLKLVFSAEDIVKIMTEAAIVIGRGDELGSLSLGKLADMVILDGDPLVDVQALLNVKVVIKGGEIVVDQR